MDDLRDKIERAMKDFLAHPMHYIRTHAVAIMVTLAALAFFLMGATLLWATTLKIPDLASLENRRIEQSLKIYDRTGTTLLYDLSGTQRTVVPIAQISPNIQNAFVASEDP